VAPLLLAIVAIGFYPQPLLNAIKEPVDAFVQRVARAPTAPLRKAAEEPSPAPAAPGSPPRIYLPQRAPMARPPEPPK